MSEGGIDGPWFFGYGSLMWRPGFDFVERRVGRLYGYHRALCIYSWVHRGTKERPGLVLGLDSGGSCKGHVFRVAPEKEEEVRRYLDAREMVTSVYHPRTVRVWTDEGPVWARAYVADHQHHQYAGRLDSETQFRMVCEAQGDSGVNREYIVNTVEHLEALGIVDGPLHELRNRLLARS